MSEEEKVEKAPKQDEGQEDGEFPTACGKVVAICKDHSLLCQSDKLLQTQNS